MRIVGGIYKGRTLLEFKGQEIRPTSDMVRESLFNILQFKIVGKTFLDLFCGTGAVGIEALSRGASEVTFNDLSRESLSITKKNLEKLCITDNAKVFNRNGVDFHLYTKEVYDYVFIDAPYKDDVGIKALQNSVNLLSPDGVVIYENEKPVDQKIDGLEKIQERKYGRAILTFYKKGEQ